MRKVFQFVLISTYLLMQKRVCFQNLYDSKKSSYGEQDDN